MKTKVGLEKGMYAQLKMISGAEVQREKTNGSLQTQMSFWSEEGPKKRACLAILISGKTNKTI